MSNQADDRDNAGVKEGNSGSGSATAGADTGRRPDAWKWPEAGSLGWGMDPGRSPLVSGALPRTTAQLGSHVAPASVFRTPEDQVPINWNTRVPPMPADHFEVINVVPPPDCPLPVNSVMEGTPAHQQAKSRPRRDGDTSDRPVLMTHAATVLRQTWWDEYVKQASYVQAMQLAVAPDVARCENVQKDGHLRALGFLIPKGFEGGVAELANQQRVPDRSSGLQLGQLFSPVDQTLSKSADNDLAIQRVSASPSADRAVGRSNEADEQLRASLQRVHAAAAGATAAAKELGRLQAARAGAKADRDVAAAQAEIRQLQEDAAFIPTLLNLVDTGPARIKALAEEGLAKLSKVGAVCSMILQTFPVAGLEEAQRKLASAQLRSSNAKQEAAANELEAVKARVEQSLAAFAATRADLRAAMTHRREAYVSTGAEIAEAAGGGAEGAKLAAIYSAIPIVETVLGRASSVADKTENVRPPCDDKARYGYGIALSHGLSEAKALPLAIGQLEAVRLRYLDMRADWEARLRSINEVRESIEGTRPKEDDS